MNIKRILKQLALVILQHVQKKTGMKLGDDC